MLALTSATGKLGSAVISSLLSDFNSIIPPSDLVICTSSDPLSPQFAPLAAKGATIRPMTYDSPASMVSAFAGCTALFLVSSPRISMDFNAAPPGQGREAHHMAAIDAARKAGVQHIYYSSLAFGFKAGTPMDTSLASVMTAHLRTEAYLASLTDISYTSVREGLYSESWPLYLGYYEPEHDDRAEIVVAGDGKISWTSIADMAFCTAAILAAPREEWAGRMCYLSQRRALTLEEVAGVVGSVKGRKIGLKVVGRGEYERYYVEERGREGDAVRWWSSTYAALEAGECEVEQPLLEDMLREAGKVPKRLEETIKEMLA
ncbi:NAD(P)-binding protein [Mytilinidion resinicola]|uniref:NAD(P)-binding protein n=1 Tax=Mytilinidion resinicola TaxID=574789 RepID=A0A6A6Y8P3_9PEZI|nr:NAD(P)-binding protein [Mytilinidion resinicola]KAF2804334.1 NAD(P)-binding protein [Mytilinidion resinicola]